MLVHCINTGNKAPYTLNKAIEVAKESATKVDFGMQLANDLKIPMLMPLFPKIKSFYTQALGSAVFNNDVSTLVKMYETIQDKHNFSTFSVEAINDIQSKCKDLPQQLANMIDASKEMLETLGINVDDKVIIEGYSASAKFANGFTILYPEKVAACISGGNSGLNTLPVSEYNNVDLNFPLGVKDVKDFNYSAYRDVQKLFYIGDQDTNDPAMYRYTEITKEDGTKETLKDRYGRILPLIDKDKKLMPKYSDAFTKAEVNKIHGLLGRNVQERFDKSEDLYKKLDMNATFKKFPEDHTSIFRLHDQNHNFLVNSYVKEYIRKIMKNKKLNQVSEQAKSR